MKTLHTNESLVTYLEERDVLRTASIREAFEAIDRTTFVPSEYATDTYADQPLPIGYGQTISQPYTVAFMLELLRPEPGQHVLDVGSGSGWTTALLAHLVGSNGHVIGVELIPELVKLGRANLETYTFPHAEIRQAERGILGAPEDAPFDRILVSAAAKDMPQELINQLAEKGILVAPIKNAIVRVIKELSGKLRSETFEGFSFVPLL